MLKKQNYIPEPEEFIAETPLTPALQAIKRQRDEEIRDVIAGKSDKMLVLVGPCSAHEAAPTLEYISRLGKVNEQVKDKLVPLYRQVRELDYDELGYYSATEEQVSVSGDGGREYGRHHGGGLRCDGAQWALRH